MSKKLTKQVGLLGVFAISTGAMISSGLFVLPGIAAAKMGPAVILAYLFSGFLLIPSMFSMAELATAMPRSGGTYFFISRSLGGMFGTIDGIGVWLAVMLKSSIALVGLGAYLSAYVNLPMQVIALGFCVLFMLVNLFGAKETVGLQVGMVGVLVVILCALVVKGMPQVSPDSFRPFAPFGYSGFLPTTALVFVSYIGLTKVASVAEEIQKPERNIPLGMGLSLIVVLALYGLVVWVVVGVVPHDQLYKTFTPLNDAASIAVGPIGVVIISIAAFLAFATTANAGIMSASRYLLAMSRDHVIPHELSRLSRFRTPKNCILLTSAVIAVIIMAAGLEQIAKLASTFQLLVFAFINIAVIVMRESGIKSYDPGFRSPLYPYVQIFGILIAVVLIPELGMLSSIFSMGLIGLGIAWHHLYVKHRVFRVGAVAKVAERVAERLLKRDAEALGLNRELRQILKEKGLRKGDPFQEMVDSSEFVEVSRKTTSEHLLRSASKTLSENSGVSEELILGSLLQRSRLGETPAEAGIALPHVLLDEVEGFHMVAARSIRGMDFPMADEAIHAIFILLGNRRNPRQHLRFLAEIARRAENPDFIDHWVNAESLDDLPALLLADTAEPNDDE